MPLTHSRHPSPIGTIRLVTEGEVLRALDFDDDEPRLLRLLARHYGVVTLADGPAPRRIADALTAYFDGELTALDRVEVRTGGTAFQREAWAALRAIPPGQTWSYGRQALYMQRPRAVRAVGLANGANPVSLVAPCHRVIGADGALTGYGGGLERKAWLLRHEGVDLPRRAGGLFG